MKSVALSRQEPLDIAVVGAGMAGLFTAWRLLTQARENLRIAIFETDSRVGGRALTVHFPGDPGFPVDLGPMMLMPEHRLLGTLLKAVGVATSPIPIRTGKNVLHLRGKTLPYGKISRFAPRRLFPYAVSRREQSKGPARLMRRAVDDICAGASKFSREQWNEAAMGLRYRGRPLANWSAREALATVLTPEELAFLQDAIGYSLPVDGPNAAETFRLALAELSGGRSYLAPDGGFQQVAERLSERIDALGGSVNLGHAVTKLGLGDAGVRLSIASDGGTFEVAARKVVLALPARPLQMLVEISRPLLAQNMALLTQCAEPWPIVTLAACYSNAWWERTGMVDGHSITDLPARQIWHSGRAAADGSGRRHGVATVHCDGPQIDYWKNLLPQLDPHHGFASLPSGHSALKALHAQMIAVYGTGKGPDPEPPVGGFAQDWGATAYGGETHLWSRGTDIAAAAGKIRTLAPNLHVCGEAWSNSHGWIEGALESAEDLLQTEFGLESWIA